MKKNKKILISLIVLVLIGLVFVVFKFIFAGTFNWKTYQNSVVNFQFMYPSSWSMCEEFYPNLGDYKVHISDKPINCSNIAFDPGAKFTMSIGGNMDEKTQETDIAVWISSYQKQIEMERQQRKAEKLFPATGVQEWKFVRYINNLMPGQRTNTVAEVRNFFDGVQYLFLNNGYVYQITIDPMKGIGSIPLRLILTTLRFR